jgi:hypothetical protein
VLAAMSEDFLAKKRFTRRGHRSGFESEFTIEKEDYSNGLELFSSLLSPRVLAGERQM